MKSEIGDRGVALELLAWLRARRDRMAALLTELAEAESPSDVPRAQEHVQQILYYALRERGLRVRHICGRQTGGHLLAVPHDRRQGRPMQLVVGHSDTVWPIGTVDTMPVRIDTDRIVGPGVLDMKAGLVQAIFALEALQANGAHPDVIPVLFISSDEEIGSHESTPHICRLARISDRAFILEPGFSREGRLKTARKGVGRFVVRVEGRAAHAGLEPERGASAILELSHVVRQLFELNDPERGITVNVGTIEGGLRPNVIAPSGQADIDVRILEVEDMQRVRDAISRIHPTTPGTKLTIEGDFGRPPMPHTPGNRRLWQRAQAAALVLGLEIDEAMVGGGSDGNTTSQYVPTLDGLGAVGDGAHSPDEFVFLDRMPERAALLARLMMDPPLGSPVGGD